jgi:hypothetical protein
MARLAYGVIGGCIATLLLVAAPVLGENVTAEELLETENRLASRIQSSEVAVKAHTTALFVQLNDRVTALEAAIGLVNLTYQKAMYEEILALRADIDVVLKSVESLRNETFQDHVNIYRAMVGPDGKPIMAKIGDDMARVAESSLQVRGDMDSVNSTVMKSFNTLNSGNEAIFSAADKVNNQSKFQNVAIFLLLLLNAVTLSVTTKRPRRLWRRLEYEAAKVEKPGEWVEPPCPLEGEGRKFGQFVGCPNAEECPVGSNCQFTQVKRTEGRLTTVAHGLPQVEGLTEEAEDDVFLEPQELEDAHPEQNGTVVVGRRGKRDRRSLGV